MYKDTVYMAASRGCGDLADQLGHASTSVLLNLAEGAGEFAPREKARFYRLAKRSGTECAALVELYRRLGLWSSSSRGELEQIFGWMKTVGGLRCSRWRGTAKTQHAAYFVGAAYNLLRVAKPTATAR